MYDGPEIWLLTSSMLACWHVSRNFDCSIRGCSKCQIRPVIPGVALSQPRGADYAHQMILASADFQTFQRPCTWPRYKARWSHLLDMMICHSLRSLWDWKPFQSYLSNNLVLFVFNWGSIKPQRSPNKFQPSPSKPQRKRKPRSAIGLFKLLAS